MEKEEIELIIDFLLFELEGEKDLDNSGVKSRTLLTTRMKKG